MKTHCNDTLSPYQNTSPHTLGDLISDIFDGPRRVDVQDEGVPYIRLGDLIAGDIFKNPRAYIKNKNIEARFSLRQGDILLSKTGDDPRAAVVSGEDVGAITAPDIYCLRLEDNSLSSTWLAYYLNSKIGHCLLSERSHGEKIRRLRLADIRSIPIETPPIELIHEIEHLDQQAKEYSELARQTWEATIIDLYSEISARLKLTEPELNYWFENAINDTEAIITNQKTENILADKLFQTLSDVAKVTVASRKNLKPDQIVQFVQASDVDSRSFLFRRVRQSKAKELPARIRLPLHAYQVLLLASGSNLGTPNHPIAIVEPKLEGCFASNTFLALEFEETPLYFGMVLKHPIVLFQLRLLAVGQIVSTLRKKDIVQLRIPVLGHIWRQDFNDRAQVAWERRKLALEYSNLAMQKVENFLQEKGGITIS